jgi:hypothetical protein
MKASFKKPSLSMGYKKLPGMSGYVSTVNGTCLSLTLDTEDTRNQVLLPGDVSAGYGRSGRPETYQAIGIRHLKIFGVGNLIADAYQRGAFFYIVSQYGVFIKEFLKYRLLFLEDVGKPVYISLLIYVEEGK